MGISRPVPLFWRDLTHQLAVKGKAHYRSLLMGIAAGAVCLVLVLRNVEIEQSGKILSSVRGSWIGVVLAISVANLLLRGWRWQNIFPKWSRPTFPRCVQVLAIGNMGNNLLPGRAGDFARCTLVGRKFCATDSSQALATLGVEKVVDGLSLVAVLLFSVWTLSPPRWVWQLGLLSALIFFTALGSLLVVRSWHECVAENTIRLGRRLRMSSLAERAAAFVTTFARALRELDSRGQLLVIIAITAVIWATEAAMVWAISFAVNVPITATGGMVVGAVIGLGFMIPAAPAGLGTYEAFGVAAFQLVGVAATQGLAVTLLLHAWVFVVNNGIGLLCLGWAGWSFSQLRRGEQVRRTAPGAVSS
jgi:glycosyltransferase 2 family protein